MTWPYSGDWADWRNINLTVYSGFKSVFSRSRAVQVMNTFICILQNVLLAYIRFLMFQNANVAF